MSSQCLSLHGEPALGKACSLLIESLNSTSCMIKTYMYSKAQTVNLSTADGYIFSNKETFLFLFPNIVYSLMSKQILNFLQLNEEMSFSDPWSSTLSNEQLCSWTYSSINLTKCGWLFYTDQAKTFDLYYI